MQGSSRVSTIGPTHDALPDAYAAAMHVAQLLQPEGPPLSLPEQRAFVDTWATTHLIRCNAPLEVVQDCTQYIHTSLTPTNINAAGLVATAPPQSSTVSTIVCANPFRNRVEEKESSDHTSPSSSSGSSGGVDRDGSGANDAAPVALDPTLDVDHCTMKRMLDDEDAQWAMLHESKSPTTSHNGTAPITPALDDVFSPAALQREAWQCWAAVLREVKVEAAVQQLERRSREGGGHREGTHASLDGLLQFLGVPETPWLMEDGPSGVLVAADMYMVDRAYSRDGQEEGDDVQVSADGTHDMRAVHAFLLEQDLEEPPLRSLVSLALASHLEGGN